MLLMGKSTISTGPFSMSQTVCLSEGISGLDGFRPESPIIYHGFQGPQVKMDSAPVKQHFSMKTGYGIYPLVMTNIAIL